MRTDETLLERCPDCGQVREHRVCAACEQILDEIQRDWDEMRRGTPLDPSDPRSMRYQP